MQYVQTVVYLPPGGAAAYAKNLRHEENPAPPGQMIDTSRGGATASAQDDSALQKVSPTKSVAELIEQLAGSLATFYSSFDAA